MKRNRTIYEFIDHWALLPDERFLIATYSTHS